MHKSSRLPGFYKLSLKERAAIVAELAGLTASEKAILMKESLRGGSPVQETVIGVCVEFYVARHGLAVARNDCRWSRGPKLGERPRVRLSACMHIPTAFL